MEARPNHPPLDQFHVTYATQNRQGHQTTGSYHAKCLASRDLRYNRRMIRTGPANPPPRDSRSNFSARS